MLTPTPAGEPQHSQNDNQTANDTSTGSSANLQEEQIGAREPNPAKLKPDNDAKDKELPPKKRSSVPGSLELPNAGKRFSGPQQASAIYDVLGIEDCNLLIVTPVVFKAGKNHKPFLRVAGFFLRGAHQKQLQQILHEREGNKTLKIGSEEKPAAITVVQETGILVADTDELKNTFTGVEKIVLKQARVGEDIFFYLDSGDALKTGQTSTLSNFIISHRDSALPIKEEASGAKPAKPFVKKTGQQWKIPTIKIPVFRNPLRKKSNQPKGPLVPSISPEERTELMRGLSNQSKVYDLNNIEQHAKPLKQFLTDIVKKKRISKDEQPAVDAVKKLLAINSKEFVALSLAYIRSDRENMNSGQVAIAEALDKYLKPLIDQRPGRLRLAKGHPLQRLAECVYFDLGSVEAQVKELLVRNLDSTKGSGKKAAQKREITKAVREVLTRSGEVEILKQFDEQIEKDRKAGKLKASAKKDDAAEKEAAESAKVQASEVVKNEAATKVEKKPVTDILVDIYYNYHRGENRLLTDQLGKIFKPLISETRFSPANRIAKVIPSPTYQQGPLNYYAVLLIEAYTNRLDIRRGITKTKTSQY